MWRFDGFSLIIGLIAMISSVVVGPMLWMIPAALDAPNIITVFVAIGGTPLLFFGGAWLVARNH